MLFSLFYIQEMRGSPCSRRLSAKSLLAASDGWKLSQNKYMEALAHVPIDLELHKRDVSIVPVPQHALLTSANPETSIPNINYNTNCMLAGKKKKKNPTGE